MTPRALLGLAFLASCAPPAPDPPEAPRAARPSPSAAPSASAAPVPVPAASVRTDADDPELRAVLAEVAAVRGLPVQGPVKVVTLDREELLAKTRKKVAEELPPDVLELQGESLRALGLVPQEYDFVEGLFKLVQGRVAGFYDPDDKTMYLLDDLEPAQLDDTLPHELVHALQDQAFSIGPLLDYRPGESDRSTAIQLLVEGDAMSAGFDYAYGDGKAMAQPVPVDPDELRHAFEASTKLSRVGAQTPDVLIGSLVAPYADGFAFVQALRRHGGWREVNAAFKALPDSTEQALHPEKFFVRERPVPVPEPPIDALGEGFAAALVDTNGELGLRLMLEQWTTVDEARSAAAGWGGDKYVVARRRSEAATAYAVALVTRMDTARDAKDLASVLQKEISAGCVERTDLGPIAFQHRHKDVVLVAGPYERAGTRARSAGSCDGAKNWLRAIVSATPK